MQWSPKQSQALDAVAKWYKEGDFRGKPYIYIAGFAGTGKSTLAEHFASGLSRVSYATFTGKAALVLQRKGAVGAQTIHSLIYKPVGEDSDERGSKNPVFELDKNSKLKYQQLLILDECSMVNEQIRDDIISFGIPVLVLGDPGQLPPVKGAGAFISKRPDVMLDEVHRQALESPIIRVATDIRSGKVLARFEDGPVRVYPVGGRELSKLQSNFEQLLCGRNNVRVALNRAIRRDRGYTGIYPKVGDRAICLRNNVREGIFNGLIVDITHIHEEDDYRIVFTCTDELGNERRLQVHELCFSSPDSVKDLPWKERVALQEFDYAYALTVHKAQGSQWESVAVLDDGFGSWDKSLRKQWMYTAVTRAVEKLDVIKWNPTAPI